MDPPTPAFYQHPKQGLKRAREDAKPNQETETETEEFLSIISNDEEPYLVSLTTVEDPFVKALLEYIKDLATKKYHISVSVDDGIGDTITDFIGNKKKHRKWARVFTNTKDDEDDEDDEDCSELVESVVEKFGDYIAGLNKHGDLKTRCAKVFLCLSIM